MHSIAHLNNQYHFIHITARPELLSLVNPHLTVYINNGVKAMIIFGWTKILMRSAEACHKNPDPY